MFIAKIEDKVMCKSPSGNKLYWLITSEKGAPHFEMRYIEIPPGGKSSYGHHEHEHEVFIIKGRGEIRGKGNSNKGADKSEPLWPGLAVFVAGNEEHQWINSSNEEPFGFICVVPKGAESELKPPC
ncbi:MAG: cupin domain-containing protein [Spirochaetes bacterium]|nr:MAG: cupin domain-containing protein [Spirochaetota bacterium]